MEEVELDDVITVWENKTFKNPLETADFRSEQHTHTHTHAQRTHTQSTYQTCPCFLFSSLSLTFLSPRPILLFFIPTVYPSHFSTLCSAHRKDLLKKLSLEVSLLPIYPLCVVLTPHTHNCICIYAHIHHKSTSLLDVT